MAITHALERHLDEALRQIESETACDIVYVVDSFGAMYSEDIEYMVEKYRKFLPTKELGIHCHNHQQLAYANTITAIIENVNYLDASLYGLGRAAGNCPMELLLSFLKNPKFDVRPVLDVISKVIMPIREELEWGYCIPYMIAGTLNVHPAGAMDIMDLSKDNPERLDYVKLYEEMSYMSKS
jgi:4-hydroxy 2-oxovalerate aldolase